MLETGNTQEKRLQGSAEEEGGAEGSSPADGRHEVLSEGAEGLLEEYTVEGLPVGGDAVPGVQGGALSLFVTYSSCIL